MFIYYTLCLPFFVPHQKGCSAIACSSLAYLSPFLPICPLFAYRVPATRGYRSGGSPLDLSYLIIKGGIFFRKIFSRNGEPAGSF